VGKTGRHNHDSHWAHGSKGEWTELLSWYQTCPVAFRTMRPMVALHPHRMQDKITLGSCTAPASSYNHISLLKSGLSRVSCNHIPKTVKKVDMLQGLSQLCNDHQTCHVVIVTTILWMCNWDKLEWPASTAATQAHWVKLALNVPWTDL